VTAVGMQQLEGVLVQDLHDGKAQTERCRSFVSYIIFVTSDFDQESKSNKLFTHSAGNLNLLVVRWTDDGCHGVR